MPKRRREKVEFSVNVDTLAMNAIQTAGALGIFPFAQETTHFRSNAMKEFYSLTVEKKLKIALQALEDIKSPAAYLKRISKPGSKLILNDGKLFKDIAAKALKEIKE